MIIEKILNFSPIVFILLLPTLRDIKTRSKTKKKENCVTFFTRESSLPSVLKNLYKKGKFKEDNTTWTISKGKAQRGQYRREVDSNKVI